MLEEYHTIGGRYDVGVLCRRQLPPVILIGEVFGNLPMPREFNMVTV